MKNLAAAVIAASLLCTAPFARAVTIDFGNTVDQPFSPTETYTEDNFQFTVVSGVAWAIRNTHGNPPSGLAAGDANAIGIGDTISVMQVGGGLFTFATVDFAAFRNGLSDGVDLIGLVNGVQTHIFPNLVGGTTTFQTLDPLFLTPIDELRIVGASQGNHALILDNFVFDAVPTGVPETGATWTLMLLGVTAMFGLKFFAPRSA
jgi:hypothetical protein